MPSGNGSNGPADYSVSHPPPPSMAPVKTAMRATTTMLAAGVGLYLLDLLRVERPYLGTILLGVLLAAAMMSYRALGEIARGSRPAGLQVRPSRRGAEEKLAAPSGTERTCPTFLFNTRYPLAAGEQSACPEAWPEGHWVTFFEAGTNNVLATAPIPMVKCKAELRPMKGLAIDAVEQHEIAFTEV